MIADLHTHTIVSAHAYSTLEENIHAAAARGLQFMATTEHGPAMPGAPLPVYFANFRALPDTIYGVRVIKGVEANILNIAGELDLADRWLRRLEYVAVGLHVDCLAPGSLEENTQAVLAALQNPWVNTLVHPGNPCFPIDYRRVVQAAKDLGVLIEINNSSLTSSRRGSEPACSAIARLAAEIGCRIVLGSDAHWSGDVGRLDSALKLALTAGVPETSIINLHPDELAELLKQKAALRMREAGQR
jgi:putative hydrolase